MSITFVTNNKSHSSLLIAIVAVSLGVTCWFYVKRSKANAISQSTQDDSQYDNSSRKLINFFSQYRTISHQKKKIICFGDSITEFGSGLLPSDGFGWVGLLQIWYSRKVDVVNRGYSGYNSRWAKYILQSAVISEKPDLIFIFFGANDASISYTYGIEDSQYILLEKYSQNIEEMIKWIQKELPSTDIILITPTPIFEETLESFARENWNVQKLCRSNDHTHKYAVACKEIANRFQIPVIDAWKGLEGESTTRQAFLSDGLHLNERGNAKLFDLIKGVIQVQLSKWLPESIPMHMPDWKDIDYKNPSKTFQNLSK
eukprot:gene12407-16640_t